MPRNVHNTFLFCFCQNSILLEPEFILNVAVLPSEHLHNANICCPCLLFTAFRFF